MGDIHAATLFNAKVCKLKNASTVLLSFMIVQVSTLYDCTLFLLRNEQSCVHVSKQSANFYSHFPVKQNHGREVFLPLPKNIFQERHATTILAS